MAAAGVIHPIHGAEREVGRVAVVDVGYLQIGEHDRTRSVESGRDRHLSGDCWRVIYRRDVDRDGVRRRIKIDATIGGSSVVLHLECERRVTIPIGMGRRCESEIATVDVVLFAIGMLGGVCGGSPLFHWLTFADK